MKLLCLLFAICVVLLLVRPCCADTCTGDDDAKELAGTSSSKKKNCKGCSPFYSCGACVGFTIGRQNTCNLLVVPRETVAAFTPYQQPDVKEVILSIWQPPQLV